MLAACAEAAGGRVVEIPLRSDFSFPLDAVLRATGDRTRLVWLTNPHNPTGQRISRADILAVAAGAPHATVVVDEAYADFAGETLLTGGPLPSNLIVGRTFAKAYGLAGLRIGALAGDAATLDALRKVVPPYSLNVCAAAALPAALADTAYYDWYLEQVAESKRLLYAEFDRVGVPYWKSAANFVLARFEGRGGAIASALAARGVHVRDRSRDEGCMDCLRITAGVVEHTSAFIAALKEVL
jgi:histidinol-phosphate aminotransferase